MLDLETRIKNLEKRVESSLGEAGVSRQVMPRINGEPFHCEECGANVFTAIKNKYTCNSCGAKYIGE